MSNMLRVYMNFDRDWIEKKRDFFDYGENPVRIMEAFTKKQKGVEVIVCSYNSMCIQIESENWKQFTELLGNLAKERFDEENFWDYVEIECNGEIRKPGEEPEETRNGNDSITETPVEVPGLAEDPEKEKAWQEKVQLAESKYTELLKQHQALSDCPPLRDYVEYIKNMALTMTKMEVGGCLWTKKLLVSMDSGFGFSTFLEAVAEMLQTCGLMSVSENKRTKKVLELKVKKTDNHSSWKETIGSMTHHALDLEVGKEVARVVSVDITEWQDDLGTPEIQEYLRSMAAISINFLCVFRVQLFEEFIVRNLERQLGRAMSVQTIIAYPPSIEAMVEYLNRQMEKKGFSVLSSSWENWDMKCDPKLLQMWDSRKAYKLLGQWISEEKRNTYFFGYQSLNHMAEKLVYKKAEINMKEGEYSKIITADEINEFLDVQERIEDPMEELDSLIGMQTVKNKIKQMVLQLEAIKNPVNRPTLHMCFVGKPGTGKTTVARIVARIFEEKKLLSKGRYIEVHGRDLCGEHIGETSIRTKQYCRDAYGSVLFIDEAYSLYSDEGSRDFGREAVNVLIQQMENHRNDMCVILAGYKEDVEQMLSMNAGSKSRVCVIEFPDYTREELVQIFFKYLDADVVSMGIRYDEAVLKEVVTRFFLDKKILPVSRMKEKDFSNARFVRNLYEQVRGEAICRKGLEAAKVLEIRKEDFDNAAGQFLMVEEQKKARIGFGI